MSDKKKFIEQLEIDGWSVKTDTGFEKIVSSNKTIDYQIWKLETTSHILECADNHIVFDSGYNEVFVKDLKIGYVIMTESGPEKVISIKETNKSVPMFDLSVESQNHRYYTNGILSHNTTIGALKSMRHLEVTQEKEKSVNCWKPLKLIKPKQSLKRQMVW